MPSCTPLRSCSMKYSMVACRSPDCERIIREGDGPDARDQPSTTGAARGPRSACTRSAGRDGARRIHFIGHLLWNLSWSSLTMGETVCSA